MVNLPFNPKSKRVETVEIVMTPTMADFILNELNPINRDLKPGVAESYAREMKAGRWTLTNQGIGFCKEGHLIDGQHRLFGCSDARTPFPTLVTVGLDKDAREVIDVGLRRTDSDVYKLRTGNGVRPIFTGAAKLMMNLRGNGKGVVRQDLFDFMERHATAINFALSHATNVRSITTATVIAPCARAYYTQDRDKLELFIRILHTGMPEGDGWEPVILLRNFFLKGGQSGSKRYSERVDAYLKTETALKHYLTGKKLHRLYAAAEELFPLTKLKSATS